MNITLKLQLVIKVTLLQFYYSKKVACDSPEKTVNNFRRNAIKKCPTDTITNLKPYMIKKYIVVMVGDFLTKCYFRQIKVIDILPETKIPE